MNELFWKSAAIRAVRTICQVAVSMIGTATILSEVNWGYVVSASILAGILSVLTSVATGLPEVDGTIYDDEEDEEDEPIDEGEEE